MEDMWRDISVLLSGDFSAWTRYLVLNGAIWGFTEGPNRSCKYVGCRYWSRGAIDEVAANGWAKLSGRLRHEHVVPRKVVIDHLLGLRSPTPEEVRHVFAVYAIGCVVTLGEMRRLDKAARKTMPGEWRTSGPDGGPSVWARYVLAGVEHVGPLRWNGQTAWREGDNAPVIGGGASVAGITAAEAAPP